MTPQHPFQFAQSTLSFPSRYINRHKRFIPSLLASCHKVIHKYYTVSHFYLIAFYQMSVCRYLFCFIQFITILDYEPDNPSTIALMSLVHPLLTRDDNHILQFEAASVIAKSSLLFMDCPCKCSFLISLCDRSKALSISRYIGFTTRYTSSPTSFVSAGPNIYRLFSNTFSCSISFVSFTMFYTTLQQKIHLCVVIFFAHQTVRLLNTMISVTAFRWLHTPSS